MKDRKIAPWFDQAERRRLALFFTVAGIIAVVWFAWPRVIDWQERRIVAALFVRAQSDNPAIARKAVGNLGRLGQPAITELFRIAVSEQDLSAEAAQQELTLMLAHWETLDQEGLADDRVTRGLVKFSDSLAMVAPQLGPAGKLWAERLALRLLEQTSRLPPASAAKILRACDRTLAAIPPRRPSESSFIPVATAVEPATPELPGVDMKLLAGQLDEQAPARFHERIPQQRALALREQVTPTETKSPYQLDWQGAAKPLADGDSMGTAKSSQDGISEKESSVTTESNRAVDVLSPQQARQLRRELAERSDRELILELEQSDRYRGAVMKDVLQRRGYGAAELTLFRRLASPDLAVRKELLNLTGNLPADSARRLLVMLIEDQSPEIRLAALTAFATTGDPRLHDIARRRAREDRDDRVAKLAGELLRESR